MYHSLIFQKDISVVKISTEDTTKAITTNSSNLQSFLRINTWDNWRLIPSSRPTMAQPTPIFKYTEIPGMNGSLDTTDYLVGKPVYSDRKGSFEFYVYPDGRNWTTRRAEIASFLDGSKMKIFLEDDPKYYYLGRVYFREWRSEPQFSKVVFEYQCEPNRYLVSGKEAGL